jgi:hypothetical protein
MRHLTETFLNSTRSSSLYCVWVPVHNHTGDRLVAIWIDPAMTAFKSSAPETSNGMGGAATNFAGHQEEEVHLSAGEHVTSILPPHS